MTFHLLTHPNPHGPHFRTTRGTCPHGKTKPHLIVVHTAENLPDWTPPDQGAENVARYASTTTRAVSWHSTVDSDTIIPMLPDDHLAYHVRGYNTCSLGVEIATQAGRWVASPWEWREQILTNTARVVAAWCRIHNIPAKRIDRKAADAGLPGIIAHADLDPDRRTDPGGSFPWQWFISKVIELKGVDMGTAVMGRAVASEAQAFKWALEGARRRNSPYSEDTIRRIVATYYKVGDEYGVRADLALAQSAKETGFWSYGGDVKPTQWNFAGIGATGGVPGIAYGNIEAGVRSHVLRMRMYAKNDSTAYSLPVLVRPLPSTHWGKYPTIEDFNGVWAVPGVGYGESIVKDYLSKMLTTTVPAIGGPLSQGEVDEVRKMLEWWRRSA